MTSTRHGHPRNQFVESRARAARERVDQRDRAMRTVARQARDREEFTGLLSMLGLDDGPYGSPILHHALASYVRQVAAALGVPTDAVSHEVSDTATAYLGLTHRWVEQPGRDLMLVWDERLGWYVAVETAPGEAPFVVGSLDGDAVPTPATVAVFVTDVVTGRHTNRPHSVHPRSDRITLARQMAATGTTTP